jgi:hypothetical protein
MTAIEPELVEWVAMWRTALPGFRVDSLWRGKAGPWRPVFTAATGGFAHAHRPTDLTFQILGIASPDGRMIVDIDSYQVVEGNEHGMDAGGEPDSRSVLLDRAAGAEAVLFQSGTCGGSHWAHWISTTRFALGGWQCAGPDLDPEWIQGTLSVFDLRDSTEARYVTRIVSRQAYERYYEGWKRWLMKRYRETRPRP